MRRPLAIAALLVAALALATPAHALAAGPRIEGDQKSGGLVASPKEFDGKTIDFRGEAVGERMVRGDSAWIHLNDDAYEYRNIEEGQELGGYNSGMAVFIPASATDVIEHYGDYDTEGDVVRVTGEFRAACAEHGGDMDIHATKLVVVVRGHAVKDPIAWWKVVLALVLSVAAALLYVAERVGRTRIAERAFR